MKYAIPFSPKFFARFLLSVIAVGLLGYVHFAQTFTVKQISCTAGTQACSADVRAEWQKVRGKSIFWSDLNQTGERITQLSPLYAQFKLKKTLPDRIAVHFEMLENQYIVTSLKDVAFLVNTRGVITEPLTPESSPAGLPNVEVAPEQLAKLHPGAQLPSALHQQLTELLDALEKEQISTQHIRLINDEELELTLPPNQVAKLRLENIPQQIAKLGFILETLDFETIKEPVQIIDLRFKYPVLKPA